MMTSQIFRTLLRNLIVFQNAAASWRLACVRARAGGETYSPGFRADVL
jgi:hypothetical protein